MKKVLLIGGGLAVVGGLAYLYLKNKKKQEAILGGASATQPSATTPSTTTPTGATSGATDGILAGMIITPTTKVLTSEEQAKLDTARDIEAKIKKMYPAKGLFKNQFQKLNDDLLKLGYEYKGGKDGILVKI